jgi:hypothetical protein
MGGRWFANRGQVVQTVAASISACVALVALYFVLRSNNSLPKASVVLYISGAVSLLLIGAVFGRRSALRAMPKGQNEPGAVKLLPAEDWKLVQRAADKPFSLLQEDALRLSVELLTFLKRLGPAPAPKYTEEDIAKMSSAEMKVLIDAHDGDFAEATEYHHGDGVLFIQTANAYSNKITAHWKRLLPWYQKVSASYVLEFKDKVEKMCNRFAVEGIADETLLLPVEGKDGEKRIRAIAATLWGLAFRIREKAASL